MEHVEAIRAGIGQFFLTAETVTEGTEFSVAPDERFRIVSPLTPFGTNTYVATVLQLEGHYAGKELQVTLHVGRQVS